LQRWASDTLPTLIPPIVHEVLRSPGQPLDPTTRTTVEPLFGHDFGSVRVHTDAKAAESARAVNALAYTVRHDIVFGAGQYSPRTVNGRRMLAHELAHAVQQSGSLAGVQEHGITEADHPTEREAEAAAHAVVAGKRASVASTAVGVQHPRQRPPVWPHLQRQATDEQTGQQTNQQTSQAASSQKAEPSRSACEPTDGSRSGASGGFDRAWQAAFKALTIANPQSILSINREGVIWGIEFGGLIYKRGGKFFYTEPMEGEDGHIDVWQALPSVPENARNCIAGDYHTHGGESRMTKAAGIDGEIFSGFHSAPGAAILPSQVMQADIQEARSDVEKRLEILNRRTYTAFLATPKGRFALHIPAQNIVFSFSPDHRLLPKGSEVPTASYAH
jgi:hypothetical protein